jgi:hypothetical protein
VLRLFLTAAKWGRRRVGLSRLPEDLTSEPADLASAVLGMLKAERDATGVAPGDDTSPSHVSFGVDRVRECKATLLVESCVYAARAVAEAYECAGVLMLGIASSDATTTHGRDMARLHVVRQVAKVRPVMCNTLGRFTTHALNIRNAQAHARACTRASKQARTHARIHTSTHTRTHARTHTRTHARTHTRTHTSTHPHIHTPTTHPPPIHPPTHPPTHSRTHTMHTHTHAHAYPPTHAGCTVRD